MNPVLVLVIEDDKWLAEQYKRLLDKAGYKTIISPSADKAIRLIDDNLPEIIVLDILLTGSTAFALLHELQSYDDTCKIPIIICSSLVNDLNLGTLKDYGVKKVLDKTTMAPNDLVAAIKGVLQ